MGFVTNRWQPVNAGPGPIPVPTWDSLKSGVKATTAFNYSSYSYTEYLIIVYITISGVNECCEFFYIPEFGTVYQHNGYNTRYVEIQPQSNSTLKFYVRSSGAKDVTSSYKYSVFGRNKAAWSLVSDNSALPNYTELATCNGYYTPFNYQDYHSRTSGGTYYNSSTSVNYSDYKERIYQNAYTFNSGSSYVYTRLSSTEGNWTHISSTTMTVSLADISYSEMFVVGKNLFSNVPGNEEFQTLYIIPSMLTGKYTAGGYTRYQNTKWNGSYGTLTVSSSSISAVYYIVSNGNTNSSFTSLDIYYR